MQKCDIQICLTYVTPFFLLNPSVCVTVLYFLIFDLKNLLQMYEGWGGGNGRNFVKY